MERELKVNLEPFGWQALDEEAAKQGIELGRLVEHACLYYLADLDSGRVATRVLEATHDDPSSP